MIYFMTGPEDYVRNLKIEGLTAGKPIEKYDGWNPQVEDAWRTGSIFGNKCIVVELDKLEADSTMEKSFQNTDADNDLIISAKKVQQNTRIYKLLSKIGKQVVCEKLKEPDLENHILKGLKHLHIKMTGDACRLFIDRSGYYEKEEVTLYTINTYLKQLAFSSEKITVDIVDLIIPKLLEENINKMTVLLFSKQKKEFLQLVSDLLENKQEVVGMLGLLLRHYRIAYKALLYKDKNERELQEHLGLRNRQMKTIQEVRSCSEEQILDGIAILQAAADDIKSGRVQGAVAFTLAAGRLIDSIS